MKKIFTLCLGLMTAIAVQAQSGFPLQFADKDGNIIADGTTLNLTEFEVDDFDDAMMPSKLYVKNITNADVQGGGIYTIQEIGSGTFQTCFPENCIAKNASGVYTTASGSIAAGLLKDMRTEWLPAAEGQCTVVYQLVTFKQNVITKAWNMDKKGPTVTLNFSYDTSAVAQLKADKAVSSVEYYNLTGRRVEAPAHGVYIVKTVYADGTEKIKKLKN